MMTRPNNVLPLSSMYSMIPEVHPRAQEYRADLDSSRSVALNIVPAMQDNTLIISAMASTGGVVLKAWPYTAIYL